VVALDAKMNFDDNALYRHADVAAMRDLAEENPLRGRGRQARLNYIKLDGSIGLHGQRRGPGDGDHGHHQALRRRARQLPRRRRRRQPGGGQSAFRILVSDPAVEAVLINIFGGIARTDRIARGVVAALRAARRRRPAGGGALEGTNVEEGRRVLRESAFQFIVAERWPTPPRRRGGGERAARREALMRLVGKDTRLLVQGITGQGGSVPRPGCRDYGTTVVAASLRARAARPSKGSRCRTRWPMPRRDRRQRLDDLRAAAVRRGRHHGVGGAGIELVVCITEGIPTRDMLKVKAFLRDIRRA
jgi:hypothetical protein